MIKEIKNSKATNIYIKQLKHIFKGYNKLSENGVAITSYIIYSIFKKNKLDAYVYYTLVEVNDIEYTHIIVCVDDSYYDYNGLVDMNYIKKKYLLDPQVLIERHIRENMLDGEWEIVRYNKKSTIGIKYFLNILLKKCSTYKYDIDDFLDEGYSYKRGEVKFTLKCVNMTIYELLNIFNFFR